MTRRISLTFAGAMALALLASAWPGAANAGGYPTNKCVAAKQKALSKHCASLFKAYAKWETAQADDLDEANDALADAIAASTTKLGDGWTKAEEKSAGAGDEGVDCSVSTESVGTAGGALASAVDAIADSVDSGRDTGDADDLKCRAKVLGALGKACAAELKAHSKHVANPSKDRSRATLGTALDDASAAFLEKAGDAGSCLPLSLSLSALDTDLGEATDASVLDTVIAPESVLPAGTWTEFDPGESLEYLASDLSPLEPVCAFDTPWKMWARKGTVNKLVVYYQGGGACWDHITCGFETCDTSVDDGEDHPDNFTDGLVDFDNPANPFKDWNVVFVPYCTCDVHWGNKRSSYPGGLFPTPTVHHRGRINALVAEKFAREHFVLPDQVFATGSSAGSYGSVANGVFLQEVYASSRFDVLGDAGNGVITDDFLNGDINNWGILASLPRHIPALDVPTLDGLHFVDLVIEAAAHYAGSGAHYALYTTNWDWNQSLFFNAMVQEEAEDLPNWRLSSCGWNDGMLYLNDRLLDEGGANVRSYIGPGSDHTVAGHAKVYTESISRVGGGDPVALVDWVTDMTVDPPGSEWVNAQCVGDECDHVCQDAPPFGLECDGNPGKHQDGSDEPLPDCDVGSDVQACCQPDASCDDIESSYCLFLGGTPAGEASTCGGGGCD